MFRWVRNLWRSYTTEPDPGVPVPGIQTVVDAVVNQIEDTNQLTGNITLGRATDVGNFFGGGFGTAGMTGQIMEATAGSQFHEQQQQIGDQYQAAQQAMAYNHQVFNEGTYGQMQQQRQANQLFGHNGLMSSSYDSFLIELKANGMPEPDIKAGDLLGVEPSYLRPMIDKLKTIAGSSTANNKKYGKIYERVISMRATDKMKFKGDWGYDETIGDYIVLTSYCSQFLPLSIFMKLPQTITECIEVMEKTLWSSRKSPILKKDIA